MLLFAIHVVFQTTWSENVLCSNEHILNKQEIFLTQTSRVRIFKDDVMYYLFTYFIFPPFKDIAGVCDGFFLLMCICTHWINPSLPYILLNIEYDEIVYRHTVYLKCCPHLHIIIGDKGKGCWSPTILDHYILC